MDAYEDVPVTDVDGSLSALAAIEQARQMVTSLPDKWKSHRSVLCIPGSSKLDEAAALVLAQMLRRRGYGASAKRADALSMSKFFSLVLSKTLLICICYVDRPSSAKMQYAVWSLQRRASVMWFSSLLWETKRRPSRGLERAAIVQGPF